MTSTSSESGGPPRRLQIVLSLLATVALLYLFLIGVESLAAGIKGLGKGVMDAYLGDALSPILGLIGGILATTLVQSSSVTTSLIVGMVGSGQLSVASAVPMIMGANIGTTVTNTIASLAHAGRTAEFRRAFAAATCHDFFNFLSVAVLLPVELITRAIFGRGLLEAGAGAIATWVTGAQGAKYDSPIKGAIKAGVHVVEDGVGTLAESPKVIAIVTAVVGCVIIYGALAGIVRTMRALVLSRMEAYVNRFLGSGGPVGIVVGLVLTVMVQSSSITTSVMVPLAGAGLVTVMQILPITIGANIGTTVTALLASMVVSGEAAMAARQIALVHLLFNLAGTLIWYAPPPLRMTSVRLAHRLAAIAARSKKAAVAYVLLIFYGLPALIFFVSRAF